MHALARIALGAVFLLGCRRAPPPTEPLPVRVWSDAALLDYVLQGNAVLDSGVSRRHSQVMGQHHGMTLVQTISCNDVVTRASDCARVVNYEGLEKGNCALAGGVLKSLRVPGGYASRCTLFCFPQALAERWQDTAPMMTSLEQTPCPPCCLHE